MISIKEVKYKNFGKCLAISNDYMEVFVTVDIGPRIIKCNLKGRENMMFEDVERNFSNDVSSMFGEDKTWKIDELTDDLEGHGGGDHRMIDKLYEVVALKNENIDTCIENSVESHYMSLAAEESRVNGGKLVEISKYRA